MYCKKKHFKYLCVYSKQHEADLPYLQTNKPFSSVFGVGFLRFLLSFLFLLLLFVLIVVSWRFQLFLAISLHLKLAGVQRSMTDYQTGTIRLVPNFLTPPAQTHTRFEFVVVNLQVLQEIND